MTSYKYVIIGGGIAGGMACDGIRRVDAEGTIALVTREPHRPYQRPPLSKGYLLGKEGLDKVYLKDPTAFAELQVDLLAGMEVTGLDRAAHRVRLGDGRELTYQKLLLATGAVASRLLLPGADLPGVYVLRTIENADALRAAADRGGRALVIGGSFIGSEVASALAQLGLEVTVAFMEGRLLERVVPPELSAHLHSMYEAHGVRLLPGVKPERIDGPGKVARMYLDSGESLGVDLVVMGVGVRLATSLARDAGLSLGDRGAVLVDETLLTSDPDIYAAGDIAAWPDATFGRRLRVEHWDVARQQGRHAGRNMAGEKQAYRTLPYFFSDLFDLSFDAWGDLTSWDQTVWRGSIASGRYACYYFRQGKLIGVLAAGRPDVERKPMQALIRARLRHEEIGSKLPDEGLDLTTLLPKS